MALKGDQVAAKKKKSSTRRRKPIRAGDFVKCVFRDGSNTERMWLIVRRVNGDRLRGELNSRPVVVRGVRLGSVISFPRSAVVTHWPKGDAARLAAAAQRRAAARR